METNNFDIVISRKESALVEWNYNDLKHGIENALRKYDGLVVDEENYKDCKKMRADLHNKSSLLNEFKKSVKKDILSSYEVFEKQIKELMALIDDKADYLDTQIKAIEEVNKAPEPTKEVTYKFELTTKQQAKLDEFLTKQGIKVLSTKYKN